MAGPYTVFVIEDFRASPPPGSVAQTSLPLTFFDLPWLYSRPLQRLLFYEFHHPTTHFINTILPNIKNSLSLTLQHFYPLAGNLVWPPESNKPEIRYVQGDSVSLIVAECNGDFNHLVGNHARDIKDFHPLIPQLTRVANELAPLVALQVTVFPNSGISIGITSYHVIADGRSTTHFLKSWASVCKLGGDTTSLLAGSLPFHDRTVIKDPNGLETIYLNELGKPGESQQGSNTSNTSTVPIDKVRATFVIDGTDVEKLNRWVLARLEKDKQRPPLHFHLSSFVLACAYVWVCLVKAREGDHVSMERYNLVIPVDCRSRLDPPIPTTYFGNCLVPCFIKANRNDLLGEEGIVFAAEVIGKAIRSKTDQVLRGLENLSANFKALAFERVYFLSGSPKFSVYDTDFGWGKPNKSEIIPIEDATISLCESRQEEGGIEFGLVLTKPEMDAFASFFLDGLKLTS